MDVRGQLRGKLLVLKKSLKLEEATLHSEISVRIRHC